MFIKKTFHSDTEDFKYFMKNADDENAIPGDKYGKMFFIFCRNWRNSH